MRLVRAFGIFAVGLCCGALGLFIYWQGEQAVSAESDAVLNAIMPFTQQRIQPENQHCEGRDLDTVGKVFVSLISASQREGANSLSVGCFDGLCNISLSDCKPWQTAECNQRFLQFKQRDMGAVDPHSFSCMDLP
ncbi:hypothetical protein [Motilimonas sp. 1_MG-2023]|uniref:hypothetical protein n=1 Tax=Motilimonas TaxID=1914248 RepID=UPI0026E17973|nr:hypothetical protein [Motilimonas sp. 1_MG-2023]MDO6526062.1 hypothetical protein [Motilimonas sp. 1_MG-2023]